MGLEKCSSAIAGAEREVSALPREACDEFLMMKALRFANSALTSVSRGKISRVRGYKMTLSEHMREGVADRTAVVGGDASCRCAQNVRQQFAGICVGQKKRGEGGIF